MDEDKDIKEDSKAPDAQEVTFKYLKSNFYRVIHVNGAIGGLSGRGEIHIGFYSERLEFPDTGKIVISPTGIISPERIQGGGKHVREIEVDAVVDLDTARQIRIWLDNHIKAVETLIKQSKQEIASHAKEITIPED